ncbi:acetoacetate--CoA ligase [Mesorhizobium sp. VK9D]|uniref:acetoacetate--CoA ligase n=1 Tax=Mesorhizobium australafricanum TaxID=3072311 RepID=UPI002A247CE1|nr:acetoacetate--CoA ligase [Mesorhizobium sp. VK9D]MDX8452318.1 acetoacetate--CoA ligase [Mesorhizobium sp. VK9D]
MNAPSQSTDRPQPVADILWRPGREAAEASGLARFASAEGFDPADYRSLHAWSISDLGGFWSAVWDFAGVIGDKGETAFLASEEAWMTGARFFPEARLNFAENMLARAGDGVAVHYCDETGRDIRVNGTELRARVARVADGLREAGIVPGDRVAGILPNTIDALVALLAAAATGAVWTSCSPDFGSAAIIDRIGQVGPMVLFVAPDYIYAGKRHDIRDRIAEVLACIASVELVVVSGASADTVETGSVRKASQDGFGSGDALEFARVPFDHPLYILYTSGTTGTPKAIVHRTGGVILQHLKEHLLHGDVREGDALLWYTNTAWMMYHWMISAMCCGAAVVLYDGAPILKTAGGLDCSPLWRLAERAGVAHLGISPKYLATLAAENYRPADHHDLAKLRALMSAGAPVMPHQFDWVYAAIKGDMMFASISGGTEILGCFLLGSPMHPVRRGQLTVPALGHAVGVMDDRGAAVIGRRGELVCTEPFPSMPLTFWGEGGWERYLGTYFADRPEIWTHGDVAELMPSGGGIVHGRSDSTLKPGGVRIGTSEIYAACETFAEIEDGVVFGVSADGDEEVVLCLKAKPGAVVDAELVKRIRARIRADASPRHVPARIHLVSDIPYTINGKRMEGAARAAANGGKVKNLGSLANPACLAEYGALDRSAAL